MDDVLDPPDAKLVEAWLRARSIARNVAQPIRDRGGFRVDSNQPKEMTRWVFTEPAHAIRRLASEIDQPRYFLKLLGNSADLQALVDSRWQLQSPRYFMTCNAAVEAQSPLPDEYALTIEMTGPNAIARICDQSGDLAASGYAAEFAGVFVYDRIVTDPRHRRRGLGRQVMAALASSRQSPTSMQVLVASEEGRALYAALGWSVRSPYASVTIPHCESA